MNFAAIKINTLKGVREKSILAKGRVYVKALKQIQIPRTA